MKVKQGINKEASGKIAKPVKVDKGKGDAVKKPLKVDKSNSAVRLATAQDVL